MDWLILFLSGVIGGVLNSIAGGGSFITFPALLFAGVPPIAANATNTFASCAGYISGAYALRHEIQSGTYQMNLVERALIQESNQSIQVLIPIRHSEWFQRELY